MKDILIIIPSLEPNNKLINLVCQLRDNGFTNIAVVDDGSNSKYQSIFKKVEEYATVYHHKINLGKGCAIKTAIKNFDSKDIKGYLTCDSDGQHSIEDIIRISKYFKENMNSLVLGVRDFNSDNVPFKSKYGNKISSFFFKLKTGIKCPDTQTGLRVFSTEYKDFALSIEGERFEYEMNFILQAASNNIDFKFLEISTIYENNNKGSHFHIFRDSYLIYEEPFKYLITSIICSLISEIFVSNILHIIMVIISLLVGFNLNRKWTFKSKGKEELELIKYIILFMIVFLISLLLNINLFIFRIIIDIFLFVITYFIQAKYIFNNK